MCLLQTQNRPTVDHFCLYFVRKNSKVQKRGKINLIGRLQLTTERMREEENEGIVQLRILRTQVCFNYSWLCNIVFTTQKPHKTSSCSVIGIKPYTVWIYNVMWYIEIYSPLVPYLYA